MDLVSHLASYVFLLHLNFKAPKALDFLHIIALVPLAVSIVDVDGENLFQEV